MAMVLLGILLAGCAADRVHRQGLAAIERGDYESGVGLLQQAAHDDPRNMPFRLDLQTQRNVAVQQLVARSDSERGAQQLEAAARDYRRVLALDPSNDRAQRGLLGLEADARHALTVSRARGDFERKDYDAAEAKLRTVLNEDPGYAPAQELAAQINTARGPITVAPRLKTRENHKVTLQLRDAPTKMVFEVLSRETGINFILDKDVKSDTKTTIFVQDVPVEQAIDLVLDQNALARQILADNMVLIYPNIAAKQKDYEQLIVRTFYLTNAVPKDVENMLKTVLGAKTLFIDERTSSLVIRDTPDTVRMAEKPREQQGEGQGADRQQGAGHHQQRDAHRRRRAGGHRQRPVPRRRSDARGAADHLPRQRRGDQAQSRSELDPEAGRHQLGNHRLRDWHAQCQHASAPERRRDPDPGGPDPGVGYPHGEHHSGSRRHPDPLAPLRHASHRPREGRDRAVDHPAHHPHAIAPLERCDRVLVRHRDPYPQHALRRGRRRREPAGRRARWRYAGRHRALRQRAQRFSGAGGDCPGSRGSSGTGGSAGHRRSGRGRRGAI